jgi:hypothetical protein
MLQRLQAFAIATAQEPGSGHTNNKYGRCSILVIVYISLANARRQPNAERPPTQPLPMLKYFAVGAQGWGDQRSVLVDE